MPAVLIKFFGLVIACYFGFCATQGGPLFIVPAAAGVWMFFTGLKEQIIKELREDNKK